MDPDHIKTISRTPDETRVIGKHVGATSCPGDLLLLYGELGSGKTCLTQGILWGLGSDDYARSPTFVMISEYQADIPLYHMDLYRLEIGHPTTELGVEEYMEGDGLCVVEWAERVPSLAEREHLAVHIDNQGETNRLLTFSGVGQHYMDVISTLKERLK